MVALHALSDHWPALSELLDEALALPAAQHASWLDSLADDRAALRHTLRDLLAVHARSETADFLETLPKLIVAGDDAAGLDTLTAGTMIGPYRLISELGHGGMAVVWLAERDDGQLKRTVALKLPMVSARRAVLVQRFARERDILEPLAHPHIARLYDAGLAEDGQPYLALEYVQGQTITAYCTSMGLDAAGRVSLLRQVMDAVQYAHAHLVIHRDLKPSNVLVTHNGQAMLLDFGIAKLLQDEQTPAQDTELTQLGGRVLTPNYAAPEQLSGAPVSIATDVYALGVLLYELLAGQRPFEASTRAAFDDAVLNTEPPPPSRCKDGVLARLPRGAAADLDTIVLKALKKVPVERYATVNAMSEDLDRFARGEAVLAQPDSRWYRLRKFVVRHRLPVIAGATFSVALVSVSAVALVQANEARRQSIAAQQEAKRAQAVQGFLLDLFQANSTDQADPQAGKKLSARDLLDRGTARVDEALRDEPQSRFEVLRTLADMYWQLDLRVQAAAIERRRVDLARQIYGPRDVRLAKVLVDYTETIQETEHQSETPALVDEALASLDVAGEATSEVRGQALVVLAGHLQHVSFQRAFRAADEAVAFLERHHPQSDRLVEAYTHAARMRIHSGDYDAAVVSATRAIEAAQRLGPERQSWLRQPLAHLADALYAKLDLDQSEVQMRAELALSQHVMGEGETGTLISQARLGVLLQEIGMAAEGDALHDAVRKVLRPHNEIGQSQLLVQFASGILGLRMLERGRPDQLQPILSADLDMLRTTASNPPLRASRQRLWAQLQSTLGRHDLARREIAAAHALWTVFAGGANPPVVNGAYNVVRAQIETAAGNPGEALALLDRVQPAGRRLALSLHIEQARALLALGRNDEASDAAARALRVLATLPSGYRPVAIEADAHLLTGQALLAKGDAAAAQGELKAALDLRRRHDAPNSLWVAQAQTALAACQTQLGHRDAAQRLLADAHRIHTFLGRAR